MHKNMRNDDYIILLIPEWSKNLVKQAKNIIKLLVSHNYKWKIFQIVNSSSDWVGGNIDDWDFAMIIISSIITSDAAKELNGRENTNY